MDDPFIREHIEGIFAGYFSPFFLITVFIIVISWLWFTFSLTE